MKKTVKLFIAVVLVLTLVAGSIVVSDIRDKDGTDVNAEEVIAEADTTANADTKTTDVADAKTAETKTTAENVTETTTETTTEAAATEQAATEAGNSNPEKPQATTAATTEAPVSNHTHNWVKVVDKAAYDEPIYTEKPIYEERPVYEEQVTYQSWDRWRDGTDASSLKSSIAKANWCAQHCTRCTPNCTDPDPRGYCAWYDILSGCDEIVTQVQTGTEKVQVGTEKIQTGTKHHDEEYHYECSECGARK